MEEHGLSFVAFSPLAQARLLGTYSSTNPPTFSEGDHRRNSTAFSADALARLEPKLELLKARFGASIEDLAAMALNYVLAQPRVACVIPGFRNERQARCNLAAAGRPGSDYVVLVKPQFEAGRRAVGKGGIVTNPGERAGALLRVSAALDAWGAGTLAAVPSAVPGSGGNRELFLHARRKGEVDEVRELVDEEVVDHKAQFGWL